MSVMTQTPTRTRDMNKLVNAKTQAGQPIKVGDLEIVPLVRKIRLQPPDFIRQYLVSSDQFSVISTRTNID